MSDMIEVWEVTCGDHCLICNDRVDAAVELMDLIEEGGDVEATVRHYEMSAAEFAALEEAE